MRDVYDSDFTLGGHGYVYSYIPKDEIWVEDKRHPDDMQSTIQHEETERKRMKDKGENYNVAHEHAADEETALRMARRVVFHQEMKKQAFDPLHILQTVVHGYASLPHLPWEQAPQIAHAVRPALHQMNAVIGAIPGVGMTGHVIKNVGHDTKGYSKNLLRRALKHLFYLPPEGVKQPVEGARGMAARLLGKMGSLEAARRIGFHQEMQKQSARWVSAVVTPHDGEGVPVAAELVTKPAELRRGLMHRAHLGPGEGMLFDFGDSAPRKMWMQNTLLPLDMLFIDGDSRGGLHFIKGVVQSAKPHDETPVGIDDPVRYVLELPGGFCRRHGVGVGATIRWEG